jgi:hypothetical protein
LCSQQGSILWPSKILRMHVWSNELFLNHRIDVSPKCSVPVELQIRLTTYSGGFRVSLRDLKVSANMQLARYVFLFEHHTASDAD